MDTVLKMWLMVASELVMFALLWTATARLQKNNRFQGFHYLAGFNFLMAVALSAGFGRTWSQWLVPAS